MENQRQQGYTNDRYYNTYQQDYEYDAYEDQGYGQYSEDQQYYMPNSHQQWNNQKYQSTESLMHKNSESVIGEPMVYKSATGGNYQAHEPVDSNSTFVLRPAYRSSSPIHRRFDTNIVEVQQDTKDLEKTSLKSLDRRRYCCCFGSRFHCCLFVFLILALVGAGLYLIFPQFPKVTISEPYFQSSNPVLINNQSLSTIDLRGIVVNGGQISLSLLLNNDVSLYSPSYINWGIQTIELSAQVKDLDGIIINGFTGLGSVNNLRFPSRQTTNFTIPLSLSYQTKNIVLNDPAIRLITSACLSVPQKKIPINLKVRLEISAISWTGIWPSYSWEKDQSCPPVSEIQQFSGLLS